MTEELRDIINEELEMSLPRLKTIDSKAARREYNGLSAVAKTYVNHLVDNNFWKRHTEKPAGLMNGNRLDNKNKEHQPLIREWLKERDRVIYQLNNWGVDIENQAADWGKTHSETSGKRTEKRMEPKFLREEFSGAEFLRHISASFNAKSSIPEYTKSEAAFSIAKQLITETPNLAQAVRTDEGKKGLVTLYETLTMASNGNDKYADMAARLLKVAMSSNDPAVFAQQLEKNTIPIFFLEFGWGSTGHVSAKLGANGNITVKMPDSAKKDYIKQINEQIPDGKRPTHIPIEVFQSSGKEYKPYDIIAVKRLDQKEEGIRYVPALFLLQMSKESSLMISEKIMTVVNLGLLFAGSPIATIREAKAAIKLLKDVDKLGDGLTAFGKLFDASYKTVDALGTVFFIGSIVTTELRTYIENTYGEKGKKLIHALEIANTFAAIFGIAHLAAKPLLKNVEDAWRGCRKEGGISSLDEATKAANTAEIDRLLEKYIARWERKYTKQVDTMFKDLESSKDLNKWRETSGVTVKEFQEWYTQLPEASRLEFLARMKDKPLSAIVQGKMDIISSGGRMFVFTSAAHEIRVSKDLKILGIEGIHGDFKGPFSKVNENIVDGMSRFAKKSEDAAVDWAMTKHVETTSHHNPKTADDFLHQALDESDARLDYFRTKESKCGYKDKQETITDLETDWTALAKDPQKKIPEIKNEAREIIIRYRKIQQEGGDLAGIHDSVRKFRERWRDPHNPVPDVPPIVPAPDRMPRRGTMKPGAGEGLDLTEPVVFSDIVTGPPKTEPTSEKLGIVRDKIKDFNEKILIDTQEFTISQRLGRADTEPRLFSSTASEERQVHLGKNASGEVASQIPRSDAQVKNLPNLGTDLERRLDNLGVNKQLVADVQSFGYSSDAIEHILNRSVKEKLNPAEINVEFRVEKKLCEHYRTAYDNAPIGNVRGDIKNNYFHVSKEKWLKDHPNEGWPGSKGMREIWEDADNHIKKLEESIRDDISRNKPELSFRQEKTPDFSGSKPEISNRREKPSGWQDSGRYG